MHILKLTASLQRNLWSHLLPGNTLSEQAAFLFCETTENDAGVTFEVIDHTLPSEEDFTSQHDDYLELTDEARIGVIKRAHMLNASLVELHSHPGPLPAAFSLTDRLGLQETVPHMRWRLRKRPYVAIVVAPSGFDALVWHRDGNVPDPLSAIDADGRLLSPTNASLEGWSTMTEGRFDRNERLFGRDGQTCLRRARIAVMGSGGLGSIVATEIALLGVGAVDIVDCQELSHSNRNRYMGVWTNDPIPGSLKVTLAKRHIHLIDDKIEVTSRHENILSPKGLDAIKRADYVIGCVDKDGVRFFLNEACLAYGKMLIDLATDVPEPGAFGGRIAIVGGSRGCLHCLNLLDPQDIRRFLSTEKMLENEDAVYGVPATVLDEAGPSVVSVNGVVASLGVTALMALVTGMDVPYTVQTYYGHRGTVSREKPPPSDNCHYCKNVQGLGDKAALNRYFT